MGSGDGERLIAAVSGGSLAEIRKIVGANPATLGFKDKYGLSPIHYAALKGHSEVMSLLLELGDEPSRGSHGGPTTPIHCAAQDGHLLIVEILLAKGVSADERGGNENTPLHTAARDGHLKIVDLLIRKGADINSRCDDAATPTDLAARNDHAEVVERLLEEGANPNTQNSKKATPLHYAAFRGNERIIQALLQHGAKIDVEDMNGETPLFTAKIAGHSSLFEKMLRHLVTTENAGVATELLRKGTSKPSEAAALILQAALDLNILTGESIEINPQWLAISAEVAGGLMRDIVANPTPRGLDFRLLQKAFVFISGFMATIVQGPQEGHSGEMPVYSSGDLLAGNNHVPAPLARSPIYWKCEQDALSLFDKFQNWCISKARNGEIDDLLAEVAGALRSAGQIAAETTRRNL